MAKAGSATSTPVAVAEPTDADADAPVAAAAQPPATPSSAVSSAPAWWLQWLREHVTTDRSAILIVVAAGLLLFMPYLGTLGLWDPWETHYGEVGRAMVARDDYVYPYWESAYFFSKPALTLWFIAFGLWITGSEAGVPAGEPLSSLAEWGIRIPFALVAILCMWAVYRIGCRIKDRTTGMLCALVLASSPQFIFIGKQAMTDGPLVGFMAAGFAMFILAVFDDEEDRPASPSMKLVTAAGIALAVGPQLAVIGREMTSGLNIVMVVGAGLVGLGFIGGVAVVGSRRDCWLAGFYTCIGVAALAKGLAVLAVVGPVVILYMLLTLDFRILLRSKVLIGGFLFLLVASPWYVALTVFKGRDDEGLTFYQRFWMHDNFNRVGSGVHGDRAGLGYYLEQISYGMFPWSATLPFAIGLAARNAQEEPEVNRRRAILFVLIWAMWTYTFFTMSQTKFHHYIFPAVPAMAVLCGLWLAWLAEKPAERMKFGAAIVILALFIVAARDLINEPRNLVNLFTYKYDRDFPREIRPWRFMLPIVLAGSLGTTVLWMMKKKASALLSFVLMGAVFATWVSHHHFNMLSPHWSQAHLFKTFYDERKGDEPIYAYQLNWRGETFYSRNRILQVKEKGANQRIRQLIDQPGREFIVTEQSRFHTLQNALSPDKRDKLQILDRSSNKFYLCVVED